MIQSTTVTGAAQGIGGLPRRGPVAGGAFGAGMLAGGRGGSAEMTVLTRYADSWERGDLDAMYALLSPRAKRRTSAAAFTRAHRAAELTATELELDAGAPGVRDGV